MPDQKEKPKNHWEKKGEIILHTHAARHYLLGRAGGAVGVFGFAKQVSQIWRAAAYDDPYADLWLLRLYDAIVKTERFLQEQDTFYRALLQPPEGIRFELISRTQPFMFTLQLATPYAGRAASLVKAIDNIVRAVLAAQHQGIALPASASRIVRALGDRLRDVLTLPQSWHPTEVTRHDVMTNTPLAEKARELMGELPAPILTKTLRANYAPRIRTRQKEKT